MPNATLVSTVAGSNFPRATMVVYNESTGVAAATATSDTTSLIVLEIPGMVSDTGVVSLKGHSKLMRLTNIAVSCDSTSFDISILNINDVTKLNTNYEVYQRTGISLDFTYQNLFNYLVQNRDTIVDNKLYMYVNNIDTINATGAISVELGFLLYDSV